MIEFELLHPRMTKEALGNIPYFFSEADPRPAREQINEAYVFGGWQPFKGFKMVEDFGLKFPNDPVMKPVAVAKLRDETINFYQWAWVSIVQPDGSFEVARID